VGLPFKGSFGNRSNQLGLASSLRSLRLGEKQKNAISKETPLPRRSSTPFNFHPAPIEDGITLIVNRLEDDYHAKSPSRIEA